MCAIDPRTKAARGTPSSRRGIPGPAARLIVHAMAEYLVQRGAADVQKGLQEDFSRAVDAAFEDEAGAGREGARGAAQPAADAAGILLHFLAVKDHQAGVMEHREAVQRQAGDRLARVPARVHPPPERRRARPGHGSHYQEHFVCHVGS